MEKSLLMTFLNAEGTKASITIPEVKDNVTEAEVAAAMDVIISKNIFFTSGGNLVSKYAAQITERNVTALAVK